MIAKNDMKSGNGKSEYYIMKRLIGGKSVPQGVISVVVKIC